jgi:soluble lytic murein transglycosylase-like protein
MMLRISHYLTLAAGAVAVFGQPVLAQAHSTHAHRGGHWYYRHNAAFVPRARFAEAAPPQNAGSFTPFGYGGGYFDQYVRPQAGANAGRHFGDGSDARLQLSGLVEQQASANGVPASLVHRVIMRESRYNPRAISSGNYGLMQIRLGTARAMGYSGSAAGLLDAETNMTYAVRYLAGAYRAAGGNENRAVALYARGYNAPRYQEASFTQPASAGSFFAPAEASAGAPQRFGYVAQGDNLPNRTHVQRYQRHPV